MNTKFFNDVRQSGVTHIGLPWYEADNFDATMSIMVDKQKLFSTYNQWLTAAVRSEEDIRAAGLTPIRAVIRADTFMAWCKSQGLDIDSHARNKFANLAAYNAQTGGK